MTKWNIVINRHCIGTKLPVQKFQLVLYVVHVCIRVRACAVFLAFSFVKISHVKYFEDP